MKCPERPANESRRQEVLESYDILNSHAEAAYDDLTLLASKICETPIAVISLIDNNRQWFKSKVGLADSEGSRELSFCGHAILSSDLMEIQDALKDERFFDNPLVTGGLRIRFYAGAQLVAPTGEVLGTLCVVDQKPRKLNENQIVALRTLARNVMMQLELRNHVGRLIEREKNLNQMTFKSVEEAKARSMFFARMSHELRTPLNGVIGMIDAVLDSPVNGSQREDLEVAKQSGESLLRLVNDILDISAIEARQVSLEVIEFNASQVAHRTLQMFARSVSQKGLRLVTDEIEENVLIKSDPTRLTQILTNLIGNAIKFTEKGSVEVRLRNVSEDGRSFVELRVSDTGIGMTSDCLKKIFSAYEQGDESIRRRFGGTGLGLAISKDLTELLGGCISCKSVPGAGSDFTLRLPITRQSVSLRHTLRKSRVTILRTSRFS